MIKLRHAETKDADQLLKWRNDPFVYSRYTNAKPIQPKEHYAWFEKVTMNSHVRLFIIENDGEPVGQIRFDRRSDVYQCEVSIGIPEQHTRKGYGTEAIRQGCKRVETNVWPGIEILARFQPNNCPSKSAFRKAGFVPSNETSTAMVFRP